MDVERLRRMAGEGDQDARAELSHRMVRRTSTAEMVDIALRDGSMTTAVKALDAASSTGLLGYAGRNDRQRWAHMSGVVAAYRKRVLLDYLASGMTKKIWVMPKRARGLDLLGGVSLRDHVELIPKKLVICRTPHAHQKAIWKHRDARIITEQGVELSLFRGRHHVNALREALSAGFSFRPFARMPWGLRRIMDGRPWESVAGARAVAVHGFAPEGTRPLAIEEIETAVASVLITGEVTT